MIGPYLAPFPSSLSSSTSISSSLSSVSISLSSSSSSSDPTASLPSPPSSSTSGSPTSSLLGNEASDHPDKTPSSEPVYIASLAISWCKALTTSLCPLAPGPEVKNADGSNESLAERCVSTISPLKSQSAKTSRGDGSHVLVATKTDEWDPLFAQAERWHHIDQVIGGEPSSRLVAPLFLCGPDD